MGDFNARVGSTDGRFTFHDETNRNGEKLVELTQEFGLEICNTSFQKPKSKLWSHLSPNGDKYQLDYILIRKKWRNSVKDAQAYNNFASIGSDHRIVSAKLRLSLRSNNKGAMRKIKYDWKKLKEDDEMQERYTLTVKNRFHALIIKNKSAIEEYERFIRATEEAAKGVLPEIK